jgi:RsiW-degrading membrane proteinase PrsW (M82 family)
MLLQYALVFGLGLLPSIIWLIFFDVEESEHAEPVPDIIFAFVVGSVTTFVALLVQVVLLKYFPGWGILPHDAYGVSILAGIEEILKFLAVFFLVSRRPSFKEPIDAMIYMITAALGFAAVENIASLINQGGFDGAITSAKSLEVVVLRFLGATLLHCVTAGIIGFHWAIGWVRRRYFWLHIMAGLFIAISLHSIFNYLILTTGPASWALAFVATIAFFVLVDFEELRAEEDAQKAGGVVFNGPPDDLI